jgi:hypothetical protein
MTLPTIRARLAAATPGPWVRQSSDDGASDPWWIDTHASPEGPEPVWAPPQYPVSEADADFIAHAPDDIAALLAVAQAAEALLAAWSVNIGDFDADMFNQKVDALRAALEAVE